MMNYAQIGIRIGFVAIMLFVLPAGCGTSDDPSNMSSTEKVPSEDTGSDVSITEKLSSENTGSDEPTTENTMLNDEDIDLPIIPHPTPDIPLPDDLVAIMEKSPKTLEELASEFARQNPAISKDRWREILSTKQRVGFPGVLVRRGDAAKRVWFGGNGYGYHRSARFRSVSGDINDFAWMVTISSAHPFPPHSWPRGFTSVRIAFDEEDRILGYVVH